MVLQCEETETGHAVDFIFFLNREVITVGQYIWAVNELTSS